MIGAGRFSCAGAAFLALLLLASSAFAASGSGAGSTGAGFLEIGVGARAAAMGEANVAWSDDAYGLYFNPAGVARASRKEVGFAYNNLFEDMGHNYLAYVHPFPTIGTLGASVTYMDLGEVRRTTVASAATNSYLGTFTSHDLAVSLSYARPIRSFLDLGASIKFINESLDDRSASAVAVDMGAIIRPPVQGLTLGVSLSNLGSSLKFVREKDELPLTVRAGIAYRSPNRVWGLASDMAWVRRQDIEGHFGGEVWVWPEHLALRAGFNTANDADNGFTAGAGFKWEDVGVDYAFTPFGDLGDGHQVSLTAQFGAPRTQPGGAARLPQTASGTRTRPTTQPDYGRVEPPLSPLAGSAAPALVYVLPFVYQNGPPEHDWVGSSVPEIFYHKWLPQGIVANSVTDARYTVEGNYWIVDNTLIVNATLKEEGWEARSFQWRGEASRMFLLFDTMVDRVTRELSTRGVAFR